MQISTKARSGTIRTTLVVLALLAATPFLPLGERLHFFVAIGVIYAIAAVGLDLFSGYCGQLTFGNFGFVAIGAYSSAVLAGQYGWPPWATIPASVCVAGVLGLCLGAATVRLPHLGTAMGTFFFASLVTVALRGATLAPWTHGPNGLAVEQVTIADAPISQAGIFWLAWVLLTVVALISYRFANCRAGRVLRLIKRSGTVAEAMGVNVLRYKLAAFVWSAMAAGLAGFVYGQAVEFIIPEGFPGFESVILLTMAIIGGLGSIAGPIIGAVLFSIATELTRSAADIRQILFAVLLLGALIYAPDGFYALIDRMAKAARRRMEQGRAAPAGSVTGAATPQAIAGKVTGKTMLEFDHVQVRFGGITAIADISFSVKRQSIHAIIGPNGAGKTTLLNCISGLQRHEGEIRFEGAAISGRAARSLRRSGISRTFQNPSLVSDLTVEENVELGCYGEAPSSPFRDVVPLPSTVGRDRAANKTAHQALDAVGFPVEKRRMLAEELSLAEQKIVDIARAIVGTPRLLLLDEPTAGLAENEIELIASVLRRVNLTSGVTIVVIAHHIGFVRSVADFTTVLDFGRVIADGQPNEVTRRATVMDVFLGVEDVPA